MTEIFKEKSDIQIDFGEASEQTDCTIIQNYENDMEASNKDFECELLDEVK